jgi:hypothetical protein
MNMNDQMMKGSEAGEQPTVGRPQWQRPEVSVLDVERGTLSGGGSISDNPSGSTS